MTNAGLFGGLGEVTCATLFPQSTFPTSNCLWFRALKSETLTLMDFSPAKLFQSLLEHKYSFSIHSILRQKIHV